MEDVPRAKFAEQLARSWHDGQVDQAGNAYIRHIEAVVGAVYDKGESHQVVAWLHDTIEDTAIPADAFTYLLSTEREAVYLLTRRHRELYSDYIARIADVESMGLASGGLARDVKIADLIHNLSRLEQLPKDRADSLRSRYEGSLTKLGVISVGEGVGEGVDDEQS